MIRRIGLALVALGGGCGSLPTTSEGVAFLQIEIPANRTVAVGDSLQIHASALDKDGAVLDVPIFWRTPDTTITVGHTTGIVTGVFPDSGRVQAYVGDNELSTNFLTIKVVEPAPAARRP